MMVLPAWPVLSKLLKELAHLCVGIADAGRVVAAHGVGEFGDLCVDRAARLLYCMNSPEPCQVV